MRINLDNTPATPKRALPNERSFGTTSTNGHTRRNGHVSTVRGAGDPVDVGIDPRMQAAIEVAVTAALAARGVGAEARQNGQQTTSTLPSGVAKPAAIYAAIAEAYGCAEETVRANLHRTGRKNRPNSPHFRGLWVALAEADPATRRALALAWLAETYPDGRTRYAAILYGG